MIKYLDLQQITQMHEPALSTAVQQVINSGWYLKGNATQAFEKAYANYIGTRHCVACGNGLDALTLMLRAYIELGYLSHGDEIIVPANTYIATILSITENRLTPILVEPSLDSFQIDDSLIEKAITPRTKAILLVHLYGKCAYTEVIASLCKKYQLLLLEDNAQAHGCTFDGKKTGALGHAAAHSFYPGKNLGALGDAGAVTTNDSALADMVATLGNYGSHKKYVFDHIGYNSRMDEIQAAVLSVKLQRLDDMNQSRINLAKRYIEEIKNPHITVPSYNYLSQNVFHIFPILCKEREKLATYLKEKGIETMIHYPIAPHQQRCYPQWNQCSYPITEHIHNTELSIPLSPVITSTEANTIIQALNFYQ